MNNCNNSDGGASWLTDEIKISVARSFLGQPTAGQFNLSFRTKTDILLLTTKLLLKIF